MRGLKRILAVMALAALIVGCTAGPAAADNEPNDYRYTSATGPMAGGATYYGSMSSEDDVDWYYFYVPSRGDVQIVNNGTDVTAEVYKYTAGALGDGVVNVDDSISGENPAIRQLEPGLYYIRVTTWRSYSFPYSYSLRVSGSVSQAAPSDWSTHRASTQMSENYATDRSGAIMVNGFLNNRGVISSGGDVDYYKFTVGSTCDVKFGVWSDDLGAYCELQDSSGQVLSSVRDTAWYETSSDTLRLPPGTYYLEISSDYYPSNYVFAVQGWAVKRAASFTRLSLQKSGRSVTFSAWLKPRHPYESSSYSTRVHFYRWNGSSYQYYGYSRASVNPYSAFSSTFQSEWKSLPPGRYQAKAVHDDIFHHKIWSPGYEFTVY